MKELQKLKPHAEFKPSIIVPITVSGIGGIGSIIFMYVCLHLFSDYWGILVPMEFLGIILLVIASLIGLFGFIEMYKNRPEVIFMIISGMLLVIGGVAIKFIVAFLLFSIVIIAMLVIAFILGASGLSIEVIRMLENKQQ